MLSANEHFVAFALTKLNTFTPRVALGERVTRISIGPAVEATAPTSLSRLPVGQYLNLYYQRHIDLNRVPGPNLVPSRPCQAWCGDAVWPCTSI